MKNAKVQPRRGGPADRTLRRQLRPRRRVDAAHGAAVETAIPDPVEPAALGHHSPYGVCQGEEALPHVPAQPAWAWRLGWTHLEEHATGKSGDPGARPGEEPERAAQKEVAPRTLARPLPGPSRTPPTAPPEGSLAERVARARSQKAERLRAINAHLERAAAVIPTWARDDAHGSIVHSFATLRRLKLAIHLRKMKL